MATYSAIWDSVFDFLISATGLDEDQIRRFYQNASAQPSQDRGALVAYNLINQTPIGIDYNRYEDQESPDTDLTETTYGHRHVTVSIKTYDANAEDIAENIALYCRSAAGAESLNKNGLGFISAGQVLDISSMQNGSFEKRCQLDILLNIEISRTATVNAIESAEINFGFYGSGEYTGTIEVTQ